MSYRPRFHEGLSFEREGWRGCLAISNHAVEETSNVYTPRPYPLKGDGNSRSVLLIQLFSVIFI